MLEWRPKQNKTKKYMIPDSSKKKNYKKIEESNKQKMMMPNWKRNKETEVEEEEGRWENDQSNIPPSWDPVQLWLKFVFKECHFWASKHVFHQPSSLVEACFDTSPTKMYYHPLAIQKDMIW